MPAGKDRPLTNADTCTLSRGYTPPGHCAAVAGNDAWAKRSTLPEPTVGTSRSSLGATAIVPGCASPPVPSTWCGPTPPVVGP